jgi:lysyl-tRNA synthetase class 2
MTELNDLEQIRFEKMKRLEEAGMDPFPPRVQRTHTTKAAFTAFETAAEDEEVNATVTGRIRSIRTMGKVVFTHIEDESGKLQLFLRADDVGPEQLQVFKDTYDLGDFMQASGKMFRTRTGEVSLHVQEFSVIAKAISSLPAAKEEVVDGEKVVHAAFSNPEARYRERYADLAVNPEIREVFWVRSRVIKALREYLDGLGFIEVETPILQPLYGGAAAKPFMTHHNQLHQDLYLRISFELYLKRLLVGGFERVYEIGRDFRNEGVSFKHNPEFTQLEFYMAYADYNRVMEITEEMVAHAAERATGSTKIQYQGESIDLTPPWKRIDMRTAVQEETGIDIEKYPDADTLRKAMEDLGHDPSPKSTRGKLIESLLSKYVEPESIQPTLIYDYPRDISPLAKSKAGDPSTVERFEGFIGGMEICNAFTELNDPFDQEQRFLEMGRDYADDDEEQHPMDEDYLNAMRYGMPPNGGFGMGIDRLTMLFTDKSSIREVILFPHLRSREEGE